MTSLYHRNQRIQLSTGPALLIDILTENTVIVAVDPGGDMPTRSTVLGSEEIVGPYTGYPEKLIRLEEALAFTPKLEVEPPQARE